MNTLIILFSVVLSMVSASLVTPGVIQVVPGGNNVLVKGPSTSTKVAGPDGGLITSNADTGAVATGTAPGYVVQSHPLPVVLPSPIVWPSHFPYFYPSWPWVVNKRGAIIDGPSGTIVASG